MIRPTSLTLVAMLSSIAAATAAPDLHGQAPRIPVPPVAVAVADVVVSARAASPAGAQAPVRAVPPACGPDAAAPYREWHHGGLKLVPGCAVAARS
jgi:hypothetical protein